MSIPDHHEKQRFPQASGDVFNGRRIRRLRCAWGNAEALVQGLLLTVYPYDGSGMLATKFSYQPWKDSRQSHLSESLASYDDAEVTIIYETNSPTINLISESFSPFTETHSGWHEDVYWSNGDPVPESDSPKITEAGLVYSRTYHRTQSLPQSAFTDIGLVNGAQITGKVIPVQFPADTLLYTGPNVTHSLISNGIMGFNAKYNFLAVNRGGDGWNGHWRSDEGLFMTIKNRANGNPITMPQGELGFMNV